MTCGRPDTEAGDILAAAGTAIRGLMHVNAEAMHESRRCESGPALRVDVFQPPRAAW